MAYTPELNQKNSAILRRIAWALNIPMTMAMEEVFIHLCKAIDKTLICPSCRDKTRCDECGFK